MNSDPTAEVNTSSMNVPEAKEGQVRVFNLIIMDESGSMKSIYRPALTGVNETLQTIRRAGEEHPDQAHYVSLITFDTDHYNRIYANTKAEGASDITPEQYHPAGGTPLFDAMGRSINELRRIVKPDDVVLVTIITDGYENASCEYSAGMIRELVEEMKAGNWIFTYIGANQDVTAVGNDLAIDNCMAFEADEAGTTAMWEKEKACRSRLFNKIANADCSFNSLKDDYFEDF